MHLDCLDLGQQDQDVDFLQTNELRNGESTFPSEGFMSNVSQLFPHPLT